LKPAHNKFTGQGGLVRGWKTVHTRRGEHYAVEVWRAYIRIGGRRCETSYSIDKHGTRKAKALARLWLAEKLLEKRAARASFESRQW
jgi:hypothetical protein